MNIPSFEKINEITDSRYSLVMLLSKRARELVDGDEPLIDTDFKKPVSVAIEEAVEGAITFATEEEHLQQVEEERQRALEEELKRQAEEEALEETADAEE